MLDRFSLIYYIRHAHWLTIFYKDSPNLFGKYLQGNIGLNSIAAWTIQNCILLRRNESQVLEFAKIIYRRVKPLQNCKTKKIWKKNKFGYYIVLPLNIPVILIYDNLPLRMHIVPRKTWVLYMLAEHLYVQVHKEKGNIMEINLELNTIL